MFLKYIQNVLFFFVVVWRWVCLKFVSMEMWTKFIKKVMWIDPHQNPLFDNLQENMKIMIYWQNSDQRIQMLVSLE